MDAEIEKSSLFGQVFYPSRLEINQTEKDRPAKIRWRKSSTPGLLGFFISCWYLLSDTVTWLWLALYYLAELIASMYRGGEEKTPDFRHSVRVNFVLVFIGLTVAVTFVVLMLIFFIKGELFFPKENYINDSGTITMYQPAAQEHNMFLLNSANIWASTGVSVLKGDKVSVTASGSFYGSIADIEESAKYNYRYRYSVNKFRELDDSVIVKRKNQASIERFCVYGRDSLDWAANYHEILKGKANNKTIPLVEKTKPDLARFENKPQRVTKVNNGDRYPPRFGSLLLQIYGEGMIPSFVNDYSGGSPSIIQMPPQNKAEIFEFTANESGVLYVMVNDVYFPPEDEDFRAGFLSQPERIFRQYYRRDSTLTFNNGVLSDDSRKRVDSLLRVNPSIWYDDNVGEILINISVQRHQPLKMFFPDRFFLKFYRAIEKGLESRPLCIGFIILGALMLIFAFPFIIGKMKVLIGRMKGKRSQKRIDIKGIDGPLPEEDKKIEE